MCTTAKTEHSADISSGKTEDDDRMTGSASTFASAIDIVVDMAFLRPANVHKLVTKEDGHFGHVHKIIGTAALAHYGYRTYLLFTTGTDQRRARFEPNHI